MKILVRVVGLLLLINATSAWTQPPLPLSKNFDLQRFMGKWYVIANIPTPFEKDAYAATEEYQVVAERKIATTYRYRKGSLDGEVKEMRPTAYVSEDQAAVWKMQFIWPFKSDYRVMYVDSAYSMAIVGREKRDYVWLMSRKPLMHVQNFKDGVRRIADAGYDTSLLRIVPHSVPPSVSRETSHAGSHPLPHVEAPAVAANP